jgi:hypothetical protein
MSYSSPQKKGNINCIKKAFQDCVLASIVGISPVGSIESNVMIVVHRIQEAKDL